MTESKVKFPVDGCGEAYKASTEFLKHFRDTGKGNTFPMYATYHQPESNSFATAKLYSFYRAWQHICYRTGNTLRCLLMLRSEVAVLEVICRRIEPVASILAEEELQHSATQGNVYLSKVRSAFKILRRFSPKDHQSYHVLTFSLSGDRPQRFCTQSATAGLVDARCSNFRWRLPLQLQLVGGSWSWSWSWSWKSPAGESVDNCIAFCIDSRCIFRCVLSSLASYWKSSL